MADPLILLHGFTGRPESWDPVVACLAPRPVWALPLFGHRGHPEVETPDHSFEEEVARLAEEMSDRTSSPVHLVGYSLGARLALGILVRHAPRVIRATLIGVQTGLTDETERQARRAEDERWAQLLEQRGLRPFFDAWERQPLFASQTRLPPAVRERQRALRETHDARGLAQALRLLGVGSMPDYGSLLASVRTEVQLIHGAEDSKFQRLSAKMAAVLPNVRTASIADAGHNPVLERPAAVAALIEMPLQ